MPQKPIDFQRLESMTEPVATTSASERIRLKIVDFDTEILRLQNQSLDSTRRMVGLAEEANECGMKSLAALEDQDEQLDKIEGNLYKITDDMSLVNKDIKKMEQCCGCFPFRKLFRFSLRRRTRRFSTKDKDDSSRSGTSSLVLKHSFNKKDKPEKFLTRIIEDDIENEIEKNLIVLDTNLESMRHLAIDIDIQLRIQEPKLDRIHELVDHTDSDMDTAQEKVKKLTRQA